MHFKHNSRVHLCKYAEVNLTSTDFSTAVPTINLVNNQQDLVNQPLTKSKQVFVTIQYSFPRSGHLVQISVVTLTLKHN